MGESIGLAIWDAISFIVRLVLHAVFGAYFDSATAIVLFVLAVVAIMVLLVARPWTRRARAAR